jgi:hypothetical protein
MYICVTHTTHTHMYLCVHESDVQHICAYVYTSLMCNRQESGRRMCNGPESHV